jgi:hypothetical protein
LSFFFASLGRLNRRFLLAGRLAAGLLPLFLVEQLAKPNAQEQSFLQGLRPVIRKKRSSLLFEHDLSENRFPLFRIML